MNCKRRIPLSIVLAVTGLVALACSAPTLIEEITPEVAITATALPADLPAATPLPTEPPPAANPPPTATVATPVASPTLAIAATTAPAPTATQPPETLAVVSFVAEPAALAPGDSVTFAWESRGGTTAILWRLLPGGQFGTSWAVDLNGSLVIETGPDDRNTRTFMLFVFNEADEYVQRTLTITFSCPDTWFFSPAPDSCPRAPATTSLASEQQFERGRMIWLQALAEIFVFYTDGNTPAWDRFTDTWTASEPDSDPDPDLAPPYYQPVRGFGKLWRDTPAVRERLGWALAPEQSFDGAYQTDSAFKYNNFYLRAADRQVIHLQPERSGWAFLKP